MVDTNNGDILEKIENDIKSLYDSNNDIIAQIDKLLENEKPLIQYNYVVSPKLNIDSTDVEPYRMFIEEKKESLSIKDIVENWKIPFNAEIPEVADPDKLLNGDHQNLMGSKCEDYNDLIRWNKQYVVAFKYLTMLRENVSVRFGIKFKKNFEIVNSLLRLLISRIKGGESKLDELKVQVEDINKMLSNLYTINGVHNDLWMGSKLNINSSIMDDKMKTILRKMIPKGQYECLLIHTSHQGQDANSFNRVLKGLGSALIIIKSNTNYVFGAYVQDLDIVNMGWQKSHPENFLFTFGNIDKITPVKLLHKNPNNTDIYLVGCGCHIGQSGDLIAFCSHSSNLQSFTVIAPGYSDVVFNQFMLASTQNFTPVLMEIFSVKKK